MEAFFLFNVIMCAFTFYHLQSSLIQELEKESLTNL